MKKQETVFYDDDFYSDRNKETEYSSKAILCIIKEFFGSIGSVADFGGVGTFLKTAHGVFGINWDHIALFEGDYIKTQWLQVPYSCYNPVNLEERIMTDRKYDLCICLEVAEHLSEKRANSFVADLCEISDLILFSAAVKGQGGIHHVNEQELKYWIDKFSILNYRAFDIIRPRIQYDEKILWWYRQNCIVFININSIFYNDIMKKAMWQEPLNFVSYDMFRDKSKIMDTFGKTLTFRVLYKIYRTLVNLKECFPVEFKTVAKSC